MTLADLNVSNNKLETIILVLGIVALVIWIVGARPWIRGG